MQDQDIKNQFTEGPEEPAKGPTEAQLLAYRKEQTAKMKAELPYMETREKYNRLQIALFEQDILLGNMPLTNKEGRVLVPGLLGIEMYLRQYQSMGEFADIRNRMMQQAELKSQMDKEKNTPTEEVKK